MHPTEVEHSHVSNSSPPGTVRNRYTPPWTTPYIIGIGGPSGSGKTSIASKIVSILNVPWTVLISLDNFYKPLTSEERQRAFANEYDFDEPDALDLDLAYQCLLNLKEGKKTNIPVYSFVEHNRIPGKFITIYNSSVILLEGLYALHDPRFLDLMDLRVYVDADLDLCLARRLSRDIVTRGRDLNGSINQWERFVKPNSIKYVRPTMKNADIIIPSVRQDSMAVRILINHVRSKLDEKSERHLRQLVSLGYLGSGDTAESLKSNDHIRELKQTNQTNAILTHLLDRNTDRDDFVFYFDRLAMILLSKALDNCPIQTGQEIITASGHRMENMIRCQYDSIASVSLVGSGDCFLSSLRKTIPSITVGKLLIQSDSQTGEPQLHGEFLPPEIGNFKRVLLMQGHVINGASMIMAIQVLLDQKVKPENITVVIMFSTEIGLRRIVNAFNNQVDVVVAKVVTSDEIKRGNFNWALTRILSARYFGYT